MLKRKKLPFCRQLDIMDCGPACLKMITQYHSIAVPMSILREYCNTSRLGSSTGDIVVAAKRIGLNAAIFKSTFEYLETNNPFPCILHWRNNHYVVLYKIRKSKFIIGDPGHGIIKLNKEELTSNWSGNNDKGVVIFIEPQSDKNYLPIDNDKNSSAEQPIFFDIINYLKPQTKAVISLLGVIVLSSILSFIIPRTVQYMIDNGVENKNISIIWKVLTFQFILFVGLTFTNCIRSLIQAKLSTKMGISIISNFLSKLLRLPISFFDSKYHADIYQRIDDHTRIDNFLSTKLITFIFSTSLFVAYLVQFFWFSKYIVFSFLIFTVLSFLWFFLFMRKRKVLEYKRYNLAIEERYYLNDLVSGMTEIKLNNAQSSRILKWNELQNKQYGFKLSSLKLSNLQQNGINTINQLKSIFITFLCAYWVIDNKISFGVMLSIGYIVGQLTIPIQDIMSSFYDYQDAHTSFERLKEIHSRQDENPHTKIAFPQKFSSGFDVNGLWFKYAGMHNKYILKDINLFIPKGKITAIVGASGSGKTTLMKLLLAFYQPQKGNIFVDGIDMKMIDTDNLREHIGVVIQDAHIYNATVAQNIAINDDNIDFDRVMKALEIACLKDFVETLPSKHNTLIGNIGIDLSGGQKQRLFIARAVYRNPEIIFFDEATNALDSINERRIMENLENFFLGKTAIIIAHRLSTVKQADQIIVLENGEIIESGTHDQLSTKKGRYFELIRNQLELGI